MMFVHLADRDYTRRFNPLMCFVPFTQGNVGQKEDDGQATEDEGEAKEDDAALSASRTPGSGRCGNRMGPGSVSQRHRGCSTGFFVGRQFSTKTRRPGPWLPSNIDDGGANDLD